MQIFFKNVMDQKKKYSNYLKLNKDEKNQMTNEFNIKIKSQK